MKTFSEYLEEKTEAQMDEELLNEDAATVVASILALPTVGVVTLWGASIVANAYYRFLSSVTDKIVKLWKDMFQDIKGRITGERVKENVKQMAMDPKVRRQTKEMNQDKQLYQDELKGVLDAIKSKDFDEAKNEFNNLSKELQNNPDVHKVIINEVSRVMKEPPLYVSSPGNRTYQAIKKIINIRVARAAAMASKLAIEKNLKDDTVNQTKEQEAEGEKQNET